MFGTSNHMDLRKPIIGGDGSGTNGTDGTDGVDGYTPIKDVDYFDGVDGTNGTNGTNGSDGQQGIQGDTGTQGIQGVKGGTGEQGIQGIQGLKGDTGTSGTNGTNGSKGDTGDTGLQGVKGDTGEQGIAGEDGADGSGEAKAYGSYYLTTGGTTAISSTALQLNLNTQGVNSGDTSLATNTVTISKTGVFSIDVHVYLNNSSTARTEYSMWLTKNGTEIAGSRFASYQRGYDSGMTSGTSLIENITTGDTIAIMCQRTDGTGTAGYQDANGTRLNIKEI